MPANERKHGTLSILVIYDTWIYVASSQYFYFLLLNVNIPVIQCMILMLYHDHIMIQYSTSHVTILQNQSKLMGISKFYVINFLVTSQHQLMLDSYGLL